MRNLKPMADTTNKQLTPADVERLTGIECSRPLKQRNWLKRKGIKAEINARREVVCLWAWVEVAALPAELLASYIPRPSANDDDNDIGMNLGALNG